MLLRISLAQKSVSEDRTRARCKTCSVHLAYTHVVERLYGSSIPTGSKLVTVIYYRFDIPKYGRTLSGKRFLKEIVRSGTGIECRHDGSFWMPRLVVFRDFVVAKHSQETNTDPSEGALQNRT